MSTQEVFIGGSPKSGTTLLLSLLDSHPGLVVFPAELSLFNTILPKVGTQSWQAIVEFALTKSHARALNPANAPTIENQSIDKPTDFSDFDFDAFQKCAYQLDIEKDNAPATALHRLFEAYRQVKKIDSQSIFVEKSPANDFCARNLFHFFPKAKLLQIVRDPRDVYASRSKRLIRANKTHTKTFRLVNEWNRSATQRARYQSNPEQFLSITYEDLVTETESVLKKVYHFLRLDSNNLKTTPSLGGKQWGGNSTYGNDFSGISQQSVGRWKEQLTEEEVWWIEFHCRKAMEACGYIPENTFTSKASNIKHWLKRVPHESGAGYFKARRGSLTYQLAPEKMLAGPKW